MPLDLHFHGLRHTAGARQTGGGRNGLGGASGGKKKNKFFRSIFLLAHSSKVREMRTTDGDGAGRDGATTMTHYRIVCAPPATAPRTTSRSEAEAWQKWKRVNRVHGLNEYRSGELRVASSARCVARLTRRAALAADLSVR